MLALEPVRGIRLVADPAAIDRATWVGHVEVVMRLAPDDALALGAERVEVDDEDAIIDEETGYVGARLTPAQVEELIVPRIEWPMPAAPALAQGLIAGVPSKLWLHADGSGLLLTNACFADDLRRRLR